MFKKVLIPVDFSERAKVAFKHGALFAEAFGAEVELLHVVEEAPYSPPFWIEEMPAVSELRRQAIANSKRYMQALLPELPVAPGAVVRTTVTSGPVSATIVDHAKTHGIQLIVAATQGRSGLAHLLIGSVCERILRHAPCPVLVVRGAGAASGPNLRRLVVAVDLSAHSRRALELGARLAEKFSAKLELLHCWSAPYFAADVQLDAELFKRIRQAAEDDLSHFVEECQLPAGIKLERTILSGVAPGAICDHLTKDAPDLVLLGTHGRSGFKHLVLGSVAETVVRCSPCSALVVP